MKKFFNINLIVLSLAIFLTSCDKTEGPLFTDTTDKISFFSSTTSLSMEGGSVSIPLGRVSSANSASYTLSLTASGVGYTDVFKMAGPVVFAPGEAKAYAKVNYGDLSLINPSALSVTAIANNDVQVGLAFPISVNISDADISYGNKKKIDVLASSLLEFEDIGNVDINSTEGWAGEEVNAKAQKGKGSNVYKIVSPFGAGSFAFMVQSDGKTILCPNQVIAIDPTYGPVSMTNVKGTMVGKVATLNVGAYTVSAGSFGGGVEVIELP